MSDNSSLRTPSQRIAWTATIVVSALVFIFLIAPILAIMPLSFSSGSYLTYPLPGLSWRSAITSRRPSSVAPPIR